MVKIVAASIKGGAMVREAYLGVVGHGVEVSGILG